MTIRTMRLALAMVPCAVWAAGPLDNAVLHGETDKARAIDYAIGEEMAFTLTLRDAGAFAEGEYFVRWTRTGDDGKKETGNVDAKTLPLVVRTKLDQPGFVRLEAVVTDAKGAAFKKSFTGDPSTPEGRKALNAFERADKRVFFDGGAGVKVETLQSVPEPKDFDEFWAKRKARLAMVPMTATVKEHKSSSPAVKVLSFSVACAGPRPVTGWVTVPTDASRKYPAHISFHGYGAHFVQSIPSSGPANELYMFINAHGYELEREDEYYTEFYNSLKSNDRTFGLDSSWQNKSTDTAYFGWMCYRIMRALQYLKSFPEWDGKNLIASGGSMGGLQTMWAAGLDPDVSAAQPGIPWCCDMGGRETLKRNRPTWGVGETEAMRYFDPVNMAKRVNPKCRVEITRAGLGDYCCPPSGIAVLYNNLRCPKKINWVQGSTHGYVPPEADCQKFSLSDGFAFAAEKPYAFRERLETVHLTGLRDAALKPAADEFAFADGMKVDDADFADYLNVSMGVKASVGRNGAVVATVDDTLRDREYAIEVRKDGVEIRAADGRALHQAYYHLEDLMNLRRAPFLRIGTERRCMRFSPRMIHSGYGCDVFPDNYLKLIAHHGFDAIVFYIKDIDKTAAGPNQDVNGLIERARKVGLDTYLYSSVSCFAHPDDPEGKKDIEASFGRIAKAHPGAKGIVFVGESCQFPSKDPRVQPVRHQDKNHDDPRPLAGWFPCRDYPDWLRAVMDVLHRHSPDMEIVFWTYNWSRQDAKLCADLIPNFPDGVSIQGTLGNGAVTKHDNGLVCTCRDYTVSTPGFTDHYAAQARAAKAGKRRFYTMANTAGLTWDYGVAPYLPCPFQWKRRWDGLKDPQYGIAGLMETHHFGWYPSFISELAKEAYTEGGMDFDEHIRKIAARDFGEANADKVVEAWRKWSRTEIDYVANNENQYGPFRIGPAFPYNFGGKKIAHAEFPQDKKAYHTMRWMAILNFPFDIEQAHEQNVAFVELDDDYRLKQLELFERMRTDFADGVKTLREAAQTLEGARRARAEEMIGVGEWHQRTVETAINLNRGYLAFKRGDKAGVLKCACAEYANAAEALKLVERDSRLGWEPSMEYAAGPEQIRWKLRKMEELYGPSLRRGDSCR